MSATDLAGHERAPAGKAQAGIGKLLNAVRFIAFGTAFAAIPGPTAPSEKELAVEALAHHRSL